MIADKYQSLIDRCCGPAPKPYMKPRPITGIERHERELNSIEHEYQRVFGDKREERYERTN